MGLRVLVTNIALSRPSGTETYVCDLARELRSQGHEPRVFTLALGPLGRRLAAEGIPVGSDLRSITAAPDVIHGHHFTPTIAALRRYRGVPAIHICHDHTWSGDRTPLHPRICRHFGVSRVCVERLVSEGVARENTALLLNWVDTTRFQQRAPLPPRPRRALVFSNYARAATLGPIAEACRRAGLALDVVGGGSSVLDPERIIGRYDLVFAKAKAAMEAMAVGAAVILCDFAGAGPLVTLADLARLRPMNFGFEALTGPLDTEYLLEQIDRYDAADALRVSLWVRENASLAGAARELTEIYASLLARPARERAAASVGRARLARVLKAARREGLWISFRQGWLGAALRRLLTVGGARGKVLRAIFLVRRTIGRPTRAR